MDYVTMCSDIRYARVFNNAVAHLSDETGYDPKSLMTKEEAVMTRHFDANDVYLATKGQGGDEWRLLRFGHITSTLSHDATPRERWKLKENEIILLERDLGRKLEVATSKVNADEAADDFDSFEFKSTNDLTKNHGKDRLITICKSYGRPH